MLRFQQLGLTDDDNFGLLVDELQHVYRDWDELRANALGQGAGDASADPLKG
jgi:hypothetical protein